MVIFTLSFKETQSQSCRGYDTIQFDRKVPVMLELWGMQSTPSWPSMPVPLLHGVVAPDRANCVLMLIWFARNRTVLTFKLRTYAKLKCLKWKCFGMLNWIVRNRTVFDIEPVLTLNWIVWNRTCSDI